MKELTLLKNGLNLSQYKIYRFLLALQISIGGLFRALARCKWRFFEASQLITNHYYLECKGKCSMWKAKLGV